jgi:hypothetical protein
VNAYDLIESIKDTKLIKNVIVYTASESEINLSNRNRIWESGVKYIFYKDQHDQDEKCNTAKVK